MKRICKYLSVALLVVLMTITSLPAIVSADSPKDAEVKEVPEYLKNPVYLEPVTAKTENNKYEISLSGEKVTVGKETGAFSPEVYLYRWGTETFMKLGEPIINGTLLSQKNASSAITNKCIDWTSKDIQFKFYPKTSLECGAELGGFEYELIIANSKAGTNEVLKTISFPVTSSGLNFYYQPALTQEEVDAGFIRPDNVVGSYAVYNSTKKGYVKDQINYGTGKAFHIYRPELIDSEGKKIFADLTIKNGYMTIDFTEIQEWLDKASYPVIIDPTFGYTAIGGSTTGGSTGVIMASYPHTAISSGTLTSMSIYGYSASASNLQFALYTDGATASKISSSEAVATPFPSGNQAWITQSISGDVVANTNYALAFTYQSANFYYYYDTVSGYYSARKIGTTYGVWADSLTWSNRPSSSNIAISIYANYDEPPPVPLTGSEVGILLLSALAKLIVAGLIVFGVLKANNLVVGIGILFIGVVLLQLVDGLLLIF